MTAILGLAGALVTLAITILDFLGKRNDAASADSAARAQALADDLRKVMAAQAARDAVAADGGAGVVSDVSNRNK